MNSFQQVNPYPNGVNQGFPSSVQPVIQGSNPFFNMCGGQLPNQFPFQVSFCIIPFIILVFMLI